MDTSSKFDVNKSTRVVTQGLADSKIWIFDNFYQNPDEVKDFILSAQPRVHKCNEERTWNTTHFLDLRHDIDVNISHVYEFLKTFSQQEYLEPYIFSNYSKFLSDRLELSYSELPDIIFNLSPCISHSIFGK